MAEKPEDLNLPNAVINRIIKESLPDGAIISKEARSAISKAASIFVLYSTSWANNFALQQKRKTLKDTDVMAAVEEMEFDVFLPTLQTSLDSFKRERKDAAEKKKKTKEAAAIVKGQNDNIENSEVSMEINNSNNSDDINVEDSEISEEKAVVID